MERRKNKRFLVEEMGISGRILFATEVKIHDIGLGGACISIEKKLNMGSEYTLEAEHEDEVIQMKATVIWEKISSSRRKSGGEVVPVYTVGLKFKDVMTAQGMEVVNFINKITKDQILRLTGIRVNFFNEGKGVLNYPQAYYVKRISLGGMLIELEHTLPVEHKFPMELLFPGDKEPVRFLGRAASCSEAEDAAHKRYEIGIEFIEMTAHGRSKLVTFINSLKDIEKTGF